MCRPQFSRHFRQTVSRVLQSVEATPKGIQVGENFVDVEVFGIGIDVESLDYRRNQPEVDEWATSLRERYGDTKIIVARDKLDEVKVRGRKEYDVLRVSAPLTASAILRRSISAGPQAQAAQL